MTILAARIRREPERKRHAGTPPRSRIRLLANSSSEDPAHGHGAQHKGDCRHVNETVRRAMKNSYAIRPGFRLPERETGERTLDKKKYKKERDRLQLALVRVQQAVRRQGKRVILAFEGGDAAGKGGTIRRLVAPLDPRFYHVWSIGKPTRAEQGRHYLFRFWERLPHPGTIAIFDRSWYGRVLVERVEELATPGEWQRAYREINEFERMLVDDGVLLMKLYFHVSAEEQLNRFRNRLANPAKRWKMTVEDIRNLAHAGSYRQATQEMFDRTTTSRAPWFVFPADEKRLLRIAVMETIVRRLSRHLDLEPPEIDPGLPAAVRRYFGPEMLERLGLSDDGQKQ
jgi:polyphosphate kinase 2 (PPK2 family)